MRKHNMFSRFFFFTAIVVLMSFGIITVFSNNSFRKILIEEKHTAMQKEAKLIARQYANDYFRQNMSTKKLASYFGELDSLLNSEIWLCDDKGTIVTTSTEEEEKFLGQNIYKMNPNFDIEKTFRTTGYFYDTLPEEMLSIGRPISLAGEQVGYIILHSPMSNLSSTQGDLIQISLGSFLILVVIMLLLISHFSRKILIPLDNINIAARQYACGNFDATIPITRDDEVGQLAASLNFMATELSKMDEYRRNLISNISHDFRSPLTSIKGYLEAMLDGTIPPELYSKYFHVVLTETQRLTKLTSSLTTLTDFDSYDTFLKTTDFDLIPVIHSVIDTFQGRCDQNGISLTLNYEKEVCIVNADRTKIEQVIYNLIDNAIKFSKPEGYIRITLTELNNDKLSVSIKDNGIGVAKSEQKNIWERFYKVDNSRGKDKGGHGIGLAITKEIIKAHGQQINLISTEGVGSEFVFSLTRSKK